MNDLFTAAGDGGAEHAKRFEQLADRLGVFMMQGMEHRHAEEDLARRNGSRLAGVVLLGDADEARSKQVFLGGCGHFTGAQVVDDANPEVDAVLVVKCGKNHLPSETAWTRRCASGDTTADEVLELLAALDVEEG